VKFEGNASDVLMLARANPGQSAPRCYRGDGQSANQLHSCFHRRPSCPRRETDFAYL